MNLSVALTTPQIEKNGKLAGASGHGELDFTILRLKEIRTQHGGDSARFSCLGSLPL